MKHWLLLCDWCIMLIRELYLAKAQVFGYGFDELELSNAISRQKQLLLVSQILVFCFIIIFAQNVNYQIYMYDKAYLSTN